MKCHTAEHGNWLLEWLLRTENLGATSLWGETCPMGNERQEESEPKDSLSFLFAVDFWVWFLLAACSGKCGMPDGHTWQAPAMSLPHLLWNGGQCGNTSHHIALHLFILLALCPHHQSLSSACISPIKWPHFNPCFWFSCLGNPS